MNPKEYRIKKQISLRGMARLLGCSHQYVDFIEKGTRAATARIIRKYETVTNGKVKFKDFK